MLSDFDGEDEGELSAKEGELVTMLTTETEVDGWTLVAVGAALGYLPKTYLSPVLEAPEAATEGEEPAGGEEVVEEDMIPRVVLADFHPKADMELPVRKGQLVLQLHADVSEAGWAEVAPADAIDPINQSGFVPHTFLGDPPHDAVFKAEFAGSHPGEMVRATVGDRAWLIDPSAGSIMVVLHHPHPHPHPHPRPRPRPRPRPHPPPPLSPSALTLTSRPQPSPSTLTPPSRQVASRGGSRSCCRLGVGGPESIEPIQSPGETLPLYPVPLAW